MNFDFIKRNPGIAVIAILGVIAITWYASRQSQTTTYTSDEFVGSGVASDPNANAIAGEIQKTQIAAQSQNFQSLLSYFLGSQQSSDALQASEHEVDASLIADTTAAQYSYAINSRLASLQSQVQLAQIQASKDVERARDNSNVVTSIFDTVGNLIKRLF